LNLVSQYPWWMYMLCFLLGALYAFVLYRKDKKLVEFSRLTVGGLATLRALTAGLLAVLLLAPLIKYLNKKVERPILVIAQDNSASLTMIADSTFYLTEFEEELSAFKTEVKQKFDIDHYYFAGSFERADSAIVYDGKMTDYHQLFNSIEERYANRNVGAVILMSDGIYNRGSNPLYLKSTDDFPIYSIAMGDTTVRKDIKISRIQHNEIAYLDNKFPLEVALSFEQAKGEKTKFQVFKEGEKLHENTIEIDKSEALQNLSIQLTATAVGLQKYELVLTPIEGEQNILNNKKTFYIDVLDDRQKVLLLYDAPHPDVGAINEALSSSKSYEVELQNIKDFSGNLENFNLVIAYQLPSNNNSAASLIKAIKNSDVATWFILGSQSNYNKLAEHQLPISTQINSRDFNDVYPLYNSAFPLFTLSENTVKTLRNLPPLRLPFGRYGLDGAAQLLLKQKLGSVETEYPLFVFGEKGGKKNAVFVGEGLWRWRLANYATFENHNAVDELISKTVQYLSLKADKSYFRIEHERQFLENDPIVFDLQLYNESYELVNEAEVKMQVQDEGGSEYEYVFNRSGNTYFLEIPFLPIGNYTYLATTQIGSKKYEKRGQFSIQEIQLEAAELVADHNLLFQLSANSGGELFYPKELSQLEKALKEREDITAISYNEEEVQEIINLPWIFYIILFLLSLEWFVRKRNGAY